MLGLGEHFFDDGNVAVVNVRVSDDVDEFACLEPGDLREHVDEHRVLADVPVVGGEHVLRALVQDGVQRAV